MHGFEILFIFVRCWVFESWNAGGCQFHVHINL